MAFWQLTRDVIPAEGKVFNDLISKKINFELKSAKTYPGLCYIIKH